LVGIVVALAQLVHCLVHSVHVVRDQAGCRVVPHEQAHQAIKAGDVDLVEASSTLALVLHLVVLRHLHQGQVPVLALRPGQARLHLSDHLPTLLDPANPLVERGEPDSQGDIPWPRFDLFLQNLLKCWPIFTFCCGKHRFSKS